MLPPRMLLPWRRIVGALGLTSLLGGLGCGGDPGGNLHPQPVPGHPRLWLNEKDLETYRKWATPGNLYWAQGVTKVANEFKASMDAGNLPSGGDDCTDDKGLFCEYAMETMAFMALLAPTSAERDDWGARARTVLMDMINKAQKGTSDGDPIRD